MSIKRFVPSAALSIGITAGIGLFMAAMIAVEFKPQDKAETLGFEINPQVEDIASPPGREPPKLTQRVETPPPPPIIERVPKTKVDVDIVELRGKKIDIDPPVIKIAGPIFIPSDANVQPILRIPPNMPPRANRSGHCRVKFDVSAEGAPYNVQTTYCSQSLFERATIKSVQRWKFKPKISGGLPVPMSGLRNKVTYRLTDERGKLIPE